MKIMEGWPSGRRHRTANAAGVTPSLVQLQHSPPLYGVIVQWLGLQIVNLRTGVQFPMTPPSSLKTPGECGTRLVSRAVDSGEGLACKGGLCQSVLTGTTDPTLARLPLYQFSSDG